MTNKIIKVLLLGLLFLLSSCGYYESMADDFIRSKCVSSESYHALEHSNLTKELNIYYMDVKFSATNSFGARIDYNKRVYFNHKKDKCFFDKYKAINAD